MKLTLASNNDGLVRIDCAGEITQADYQGEGNPFVQLLGPEGFAGTVLVNFEKTTFIDSAGIGWLVMSHKRFQEKGGFLILHSVPAMIDRVFQLLQMSTLLHLAANETEANAMIQRRKS
jgi:anti-anti-sigma factor